MENYVKQRLMQFIDYICIPKREFERSIGVANAYLSNLKRQPKEEVLEKILQQYPELNKVWLLTGEGSMINEEETQVPMKNYTRGIPYYDVDFTLGFDLMENEQTRTPECLIDFPKYNGCTCWVNAHGDSMSPTISSGDMVALMQLDDFRYLISGEIYAIVTKNGLRTIKRVNDRGETIQLVPDNKDYCEQFIPKGELQAVFSVKACVKAY